MNILINQPAGIGDIIFCQKIYYLLKQQGNNVYWPVKNSISWLTDYLDSTVTPNQLNNVVIDKIITLDGCHYFIPGSKIMKAKYDTVGMSFDNYLSFFNPKRNLEKENNLFNLKVNDSKYRLICDMYGTPSDHGFTDKMQIPDSTEISNIRMNLESGYTLFDWIKIIENAEEIYCTDSAIMFLVEKYYKKEGTLVAYSRRSDISEIDYMFSKTWKYII